MGTDMRVIYDPILRRLRSDSSFSQSGVTAALIGDSITLRNGNAVANWDNGGQGSATHSLGGFFTWLNARSGHPFRVIKNAGVGGERTNEMRARFAADVLSLNPGVVSIMGGTNDLGFFGYDADVTFDNVSTMAQMARDAGATVLLWAIPPKDGLGTTSLLQRNAANARLRDFANSDRDIIWCNTELGTLDNSDLQGLWKSGYAADGTHPDTSIAVYSMVPQSLVDLIKARYEPFHLISSATDTLDGYGSPTPPFGDGRNILPSALFLMSGAGTKIPSAGATFNGNVPSGTIIQGGNSGTTVNLSTEDRLDGCGKNLIFDFVLTEGASGVEWFKNYSTPSSAFTVGKYYELSSEINVVSGAGSDGILGASIYPYIRAGAGTTSYVRDLDPANAGGIFAANGVYTAVTPRYLFAGGETSMRVGFIIGSLPGVAGNAQVKIGRIAVREYSTPY